MLLSSFHGFSYIVIVMSAYYHEVSMPVQIEWLIPKRVIMSRFSGVISLEDIEGWLAILTKMVDEGTPLVHHISDNLQIESIDVSLKTFQVLIKGIKKADHFGWYLSVTTNPINRMIAALVSQFAGIRVRTYWTFEEALSFLKENDPSI